MRVKEHYWRMAQSNAAERTSNGIGLLIHCLSLPSSLTIGSWFSLLCLFVHRPCSNLENGKVK